VSVNSLSAFFHGETLRSLTAEAVERFKATRLNQVSPPTVNRELACLRTLLNEAMDWGRLESNPAARVKKLHEAPPRERILTDAETRRLLDAAAPHLRPILVVLLNTGMRKGEALGLRWDDVDLVKGFIHISDSKSGKSRNVRMNEAVFTTLRELSEVNGPMVLRDTDRPGGDGQDIQRTALVFGGIKDVKRSFHTACRRADIKGLRLHDLRHTCASRLVQLGVDLVTVSKLLGHSSITMTMRYSHPTPENMRRAVEKLGENYRAVFYQSAGQTVFASSSRRIMNFLSPR
jgi:integrase